MASYGTNFKHIGPSTEMINAIYQKQRKNTSEWASNPYLRDFNIQPAIDKLSLKRGKPATASEIAKRITDAYTIQFGPRNLLEDSAARAGLEGAIKLGIYVVAIVAATALLSGCLDTADTSSHGNGSYDNHINEKNVGGGDGNTTKDNIGLLSAASENVVAQNKGSADAGGATVMELLEGKLPVMTNKEGQKIDWNTVIKEMYSGPEGAVMFGKDPNDDDLAILFLTNERSPYSLYLDMDGLGVGGPLGYFNYLELSIGKDGALLGQEFSGAGTTNTKKDFEIVTEITRQTRSGVTATQIEIKDLHKFIYEHNKEVLSFYLNKKNTPSDKRESVKSFDLLETYNTIWLRR